MLEYQNNEKKERRHLKKTPSTHVSHLLEGT